MHPLYKGGELLLGVKTYSFVKLKNDDIVTFTCKDIGTMVKKIKYIKNDEVFVIGTSKHSYDSRNFGTIDIKTITYKILFKIPFF